MKPVNLIDHSEGGRFREIFRSAATVSTQDGLTRSAPTHIYFSATDVRRDSLNRLMRVFQHVSLKNSAFQKSLILQGVSV